MATDRPGWVREGDEEPKSAKARRRAPDKRTSFHPDYNDPPSNGRQCGSRKNAGTDVCTLPAGWGTDHLGYGPCKHHMGATPTGRKSAAIERGEELMVFYGKPVDINPIDALLDEVRTTAGHKAWLAAEIARVKEDLVSKEGKPNGLSPELEGIMRLYAWERDHLVKTAKACLDAGVNERLVQIAQAQGEKLADAVDAILAQLNLTTAQQALVPRVVPNVLRGLVGERAGGMRVIEGVIE